LDVKLVLRKIWSLTMEWKIICAADKAEELAKWGTYLEKQIKDPLQITSG
jgi:hypothetical protein